MSNTSAATIGSFFSTPSSSLLPGNQRPPWENGEKVSYVQSGRQALASIGRIYASEGRDELLIPDYLCNSMLEGFDLSHWELRTYRINSELMIDTEDLLSKVGDPPRTVVLSATYFGNEPSLRHRDRMKDLQDIGVRIIEDETHRIFGELNQVGDVAIASLRKLLPVADGAYIRGDLDFETSQDASSIGWMAMDEKASGNIENAKSLYAQGNQEISSRTFDPTLPTSRSLNVIEALDYEFIRNRRRSNAHYLRLNLKKRQYLEIVVNAEIPSHLLVRIPEAKFAQKKLADRGVFCPIHWPQPEHLSNLQWRHDLLSIPIDHRYDREDMQRIIDDLDSIYA